VPGLRLVGDLISESVVTIIVQSNPTVDQPSNDHSADALTLPKTLSDNYMSAKIDSE
jgi:hypothetical protein